MLSLYCNKWVRCLLKAKLTIIFSYEIITYIVAIKSKSVILNAVEHTISYFL